jgi:hypothetical protein
MDQNNLVVPDPSRRITRRAASRQDPQEVPEFAQAATAKTGPSASVVTNREVLPMACRSFHELYSDAAKDPWKGNYAGIMRQFDTNVEAPLDGRDLWEKVIRLRPGYPQSYLMCSHTANGT